MTERIAGKSGERMSAYVIVEIEVTNPQEYEIYKTEAPPAIANLEVSRPVIGVA